MAAIDFSTLRGLSETQPLITRPDLEKAYLVAWLLVLTIQEILGPSMRIVKTQADMDRVNAEAARSAGDIQYLDMRSIYPRLAPMSSQQVDAVFNTAYGNRSYISMAGAFWNQVAAPLLFVPPDKYCLSVTSVLNLNQ